MQTGDSDGKFKQPFGKTERGQAKYDARDKCIRPEVVE
jgi:hypothetical protein